MNFFLNVDTTTLHANLIKHFLIDIFCLFSVTFWTIIKNIPQPTFIHTFSHSFLQTNDSVVIQIHIIILNNARSITL